MSQGLAYFLLLLGQFSIAVNVTVSKDALAFIPPYTLCGLRFLVSSILLGCFYLIKRPPLCDPRHPEGKLNKNDYLQLFGEALTGGFLFNILFYLGLDYTTATSTGIIASTLPAFIAVLAYFILKEQVSSKKWAAIALSMGGIAVLSIDNSLQTDSPSGSWLGDILILSAMLPEALYSIFSRNLKYRVTPLAAAFVANATTFVLLIPFMLPGWSETWAVMNAHIATMIFLGGAASFTFFWAWSVGLQTVPASTAALFGGILPVATASMAILFLGETFHLTDAFGMILVVGAIFLGSSQTQRAKRRAF